MAVTSREVEILSAGKDRCACHPNGCSACSCSMAIARRSSSDCSATRRSTQPQASFVVRAAIRPPCCTSGRALRRVRRRQLRSWTSAPRSVGLAASRIPGLSLTRGANGKQELRTRDNLGHRVGRGRPATPAARYRPRPKCRNRQRLAAFFVGGGKSLNIFSTALFRVSAFFWGLSESVLLEVPLQIASFVFASKMSTTSVPTS